MIKVHHLGISQSERIVWLCEELELPYELVKYDRDPETRLAPAAYKALHPSGMAPVIEDDGLVLGESGAIVDYIIARHGGGRLAVPAAAPNFPDYLYWYHFANGSLVASGMSLLVAGMLGATAEQLGLVGRRSDTAHQMLEARLGEVPYLAGADFTAADIMLVFGLTTMRVFVPRDLTPFPNIRAYLQRIGARPAYARAMAKGDPGFTPLLV
ncbi:glutathione S-transferase family protein [Marinibaculum pumilum]|uniref:Glutathione S-transferase family protein n=1 Tax=Marinibaculum pumilum TaxID=1766165 RepID=A0ABV7L0L1_9PROT